MMLSPSELYDLAEKISESSRPYHDIGFEARRDYLWVDSDKQIEIAVRPEGDVYVVELSWPYTTQWDETESVEVDVGEYKTATGAIRRAFETALLDDEATEELFNEVYKHEQQAATRARASAKARR